MNSRRAPGWQLILADLALILFLVTLTALASEESDALKSDARPVDGPESENRAHTSPGAQTDLYIAASQALFRPVPLGPSLREWLRAQSADPRATLTVFGQYTSGDEAAIWGQTQALADDAAQNGFPVRVVITQGQVSDVYASLAYDAVPPEPDTVQAPSPTGQSAQ